MVRRVRAEVFIPLPGEIVHVAPKTILVVEDNVDARQALGELIELYGYNVTCAENGLDALNKIRSLPQPPALILLDLFMPLMDGYTFVARARTDSRIKQVPVVAMTGQPWVPPSSVDAILTKPIRSDTLLHTIRQFVKPADALNSSREPGS